MFGSIHIDPAYIVLALVCYVMAAGFAYCILSANKISEPAPAEPAIQPVDWPIGTVGLRPYNHEHRVGVPLEREI